MANRYISDELFHLVGRKHPSEHETNYIILLKILDSNCISHPPHSSDWGTHQINFNWDKDIIDEGLIVPTVTCFCDIPLEHLNIHVRKYGMFGLSFHRSYLIQYGARPVCYIPVSRGDILSIYGSTMLRDIEQVWRGFREHVIHPLNEYLRGRTIGIKPNDSKEAVLAIDDVITQQFLAFIKPFYSELPDHHPENYYFEREWRKFGNLRFQHDDIHRIIVAPEYVDKLKKDRPAYANIVEALTL